MPYILNTQHLTKNKEILIKGPTRIAVCIPVELKATAFVKFSVEQVREQKIAEQAFEKNASIPKKAPSEK